MKVSIGKMKVCSCVQSIAVVILVAFGIAESHAQIVDPAARRVRQTKQPVPPVRQLPARPIKDAVRMPENVRQSPAPVISADAMRAIERTQETSIPLSTLPPPSVQPPLQSIGQPSVESLPSETRAVDLGSRSPIQQSPPVVDLPETSQPNSIHRDLEAELTDKPVSAEMSDDLLPPATEHSQSLPEQVHQAIEELPGASMDSSELMALPDINLWDFADEIPDAEIDVSLDTDPGAPGFDTSQLLALPEIDLWSRERSTNSTSEEPNSSLTKEPQPDTVAIDIQSDLPDPPTVDPPKFQPVAEPIVAHRELAVIPPFASPPPFSRTASLQTAPPAQMANYQQTQSQRHSAFQVESQQDVAESIQAKPLPSAQSFGVPENQPAVVDASVVTPAPVAPISAPLLAAESNAPTRVHSALTAPIPTDVELPRYDAMYVMEQPSVDQSRIPGGPSNVPHPSSGSAAAGHPAEPRLLAIDHSRVERVDYQAETQSESLAPSTVPGSFPSISQWTEPKQIQSTLKTMALLAIVSLAPAVLLMTTSFVRISVVLSLLRQALGTQMLPSNQMVTSLSLFLSLLVMFPTWKQVYDEAVVPYSGGVANMTAEEAWATGVAPVRKFMSNQIERAGNTEDVLLFYNYLPNSNGTPQYYEDVPIHVLLPAFMVSELKVAFLIGFQIFIPFLVLDLVVSSLTVSTGMMMLPPATISLPLKLILFVLVDGWHLVIGMLLQSFALG